MTSSDSANAYPIREAFRKFYPAYLEKHPSLSPEERRTAEAIMKCKTGEAGYTVSCCEECGVISVHYASCNNRSCPCCQTPQEKKWVRLRDNELIRGIAYYHVIFTVPHDLNDLIEENRKLLLDLLFKSVNGSLLSLCADPGYMGAMPGIVSVLHTWGQTLSFHPHVHVCMSGGGITGAKKFRETKHKGFLIPRPVLASSFRGRYLCGLKELYYAGKMSFCWNPDLEDPEKFDAFINSLFEKKWQPFIKETFNGKGNAIQYLARYSYRSAIANSRIISVTDETVTFRYKDYADNSALKEMTVSGESFISLYLQHILPKGFSRIRYAGYLANCRKTKMLELINSLRGIIWEPSPFKDMCMADLMKRLFNKDIGACPHCSGRLLIMARDRPTRKKPVDMKKLHSLIG